MLTGERGLPITSALRFLCVYDDRYSVIALGNKRYGSEPPRPLKRVCWEKQHEFFSSFGNPPDRGNIY